MLNKTEVNRIFEDPEYIHSPKLDNSLSRFLEHYPNGAEDSIVCKALGMTQQELDEVDRSAIEKLRQDMNP